MEYRTPLNQRRVPRDRKALQDVLLLGRKQTPEQRTGRAALCKGTKDLPEEMSPQTGRLIGRKKEGGWG